jgi:hypothetical protein
MVRNEVLSFPVFGGRKKYLNLHTKLCLAMLALCFWCSQVCLLASDFSAFWDSLGWSQNTVRVVNGLLVH